LEVVDPPRPLEEFPSSQNQDSERMEQM